MAWLFMGWLVSALPWDTVGDIDWEHLLSKVECLWEHGSAMCRDWHKK